MEKLLVHLEGHGRAVGVHGVRWEVEGPREYVPRGKGVAMLRRR